MGGVRCKHCGVGNAAIWIPVFGEKYRKGCARQEETNGGSMCQSMRIDLLSAALRRAVAPQCFDDRGFILPGRLIEALEAERDAMRKAAAATRGPLSVDAAP